MDLSYTLQRLLRWLSGEECLQPSLALGIPSQLGAADPVSCLWPPLMYCIVCVLPSVYLHTVSKIYNVILFKFMPWVYEITWRRQRKSVTSLCLDCDFLNRTRNAQPKKAKPDKWDVSMAQEAGLWRRHRIGWDRCQSHIWWSRRTQRRACSYTAKQSDF